MIFKTIKSFLKLFFTPTIHDKTPSNPLLDVKLATVKYHLHNLEPEIKFIIKTKIKRFFIYRWKFILVKLCQISVIVTLFYFAAVKIVEPVFVKIEPRNITDTVYSYPTDTSMTLENFLLQIQFTESRYNPSAHREGSQYWGLYQIGIDARRIGGYEDISKSVFENHPEIQHMCMINLLKHNKEHMQKYIDKYDGQIIDGVLVTESGILALCQLGCGAARGYLDDGKFPQQDEHGNSPRSLIKLGGYKLDLNKFNFSKLDGTKFIK